MFAGATPTSNCPCVNLSHDRSRRNATRPRIASPGGARSCEPTFAISARTDCTAGGSSAPAVGMMMKSERLDGLTASPRLALQSIGPILPLGLPASPADRESPACSHSFCSGHDRQLTHCLRQQHAPSIAIEQDDPASRLHGCFDLAELGNHRAQTAGMPRPAHSGCADGQHWSMSNRL